MNVVLTTYEMINLPYASNEPDLGNTHWRCLVVDEAHRLKVHGQTLSSARAAAGTRARLPPSHAHGRSALLIASERRLEAQSRAGRVHV